MTGSLLLKVICIGLCFISHLPKVEGQSFCTQTLLQLCLDGWTDDFKSEPWFDLSLQPMMPYQRKEWCSLFSHEWDTCLQIQLSDCSDDMRDELWGLHDAQEVLCDGMSDWEYEQMWKCLQLSDTGDYQAGVQVCDTAYDSSIETILNKMDSQHSSYDASYTTGYKDICSAVKDWNSCVEQAARDSCGETTAWFAAEFTFQRNHRSMQTSLGCTLDEYVPPSACDTTQAEQCITDSLDYWNNNFQALSLSNAARNMSLLSGCLFDHLAGCEEAVQDQYIDLSQNTEYQLAALSYNSTLTDLIGGWPVAAVETEACSDYVSIQEPDRSPAVPFQPSRLIDDSTLSREGGWARFDAYNGPGMSTSASDNSCGNKIPVYIDGVQPVSEFGEDVPMWPVDICASVGDTCVWKNKLKVKLCKTSDGEEFYSYYLRPLPSPLMAYCAGTCQLDFNYIEIGGKAECKHKDCSAVEEWNPQLKTCLEGAPVMSGPPVISPPALENSDALFKCTVDYPDNDGARFVITWYLDGVEISGSAEDVDTISPVGTQRGSDLPDNAMDKQLTCTAYAYWPGWKDQPSTVHTSQPLALSSQVSETPTVNEVDETPADAAVIPGIPFFCQDSDSITVEVEDSGYLTLESCTVDLCNKEQVSVTVTTQRDTPLKQQGTTSHLQFGPIQSTVPVFDSAHLPNVQVVVVDEQPVSQCVYLGHGNLLAWDEAAHRFTQSGTFLMWKTHNREVQIRTLDGVMCGLMVREGGLVLGVDLCDPSRLAPVSVQRLLNEQDQTDGYISVDSSGNIFQVSVGSGLVVRVYVDLSDSPMMSVIVQDLVTDGGQGMCRAGGSVEEINNNNRVSESENLFRDACGEYTATPRRCVCQAGEQACPKPPENTVTPENWLSSCSDQSRKKRAIPKMSDTSSLTYGGYSFPADDSETVPVTSSQMWPTLSGVTEEQAVAACEEAFQSSSVYNDCVNVIDMQPLMDTCVQEVQTGDSLTLALTSAVVSVMEQTCALSLQSSIILGSPEQDSQSSAAQQVSSNICPALCSGHGDCVSGVCQCHEGYVGSDCGLTEGEAPQLWAVEETQCDINLRPWQLIRVYGQGFWDSASLACRITHLQLSESGDHLVTSVEQTTASMNSAYEVLCDIPVSPVSPDYTGVPRKTEHGVKISVTTDGVTFSEDILVVIYDSQCRACTQEGVCTTLEGTCHYDGVCLTECEDPCVDYVDIGHPRRSTAYNIQKHPAPTVICDQLIHTGSWYRFSQYTGGQMPESCVEPYHCATQSPIWLQGTHPTASDPGPLSATVCANKPSLDSADSECCDWSAPIQVKFCPLSVAEDSYYVYKLVASPECEMAYCAGDGVPCEDGYGWDEQTETCYELDECLSSPCFRGNCTDLLDAFSCSCEPGFTGDLCQVDIDECLLGSDCLRGGVCVDGENSYTCSCPSGYTGSRCELEVDECESQPCAHGGQCTDMFDGYSCQCADTFTGTDCQLGLWGEWSEASGCSRSCGHGRVSRTRQCESSAPCAGSADTHQVCIEGECQDTYSDENMEGAVIAIPYSHLETAVVGEPELVEVLVAAMNYYCETHKHDFCESFGLESKTSMMTPEAGMISAEHIEVKFVLQEQEDADPTTMIQVIVKVDTDELSQYCSSSTDLSDLPDAVHLKDTVVRDAIIQYTSHIESTVSIEVEYVQTTSDALRQSSTTDAPGSTTVPIIVAATIFGTAAVVVIACIARGVYRSKCVKERAKRSISKVSVNPVDGPETSRPPTPASLFSASSIKVGSRPQSGASVRPYSGHSAYRPYSGTSSRPFSGAFGRPLTGLSRPSSSVSGRPMSSNSTRSGTVIPAVPARNILNPRVTSVYEHVLSDKSNFSDKKRSAGHPTRISSINFEEMKPGSGAARCEKTNLITGPVEESDGLPAAAGNF